MVEVYPAFLMVGFVIFLGFLGNALFKRTGIPDILILIFLGVLIGPITGFLDPKDFVSIMPYFAALAIIIILFDGGLDLEFDKLLHMFGISVVQTTIGFVLSLSVITVVVTILLGYPPIIGLLLGAILGGTSSAIIIPLVTKLSIKKETSIILTMESVLTDVYCIVVAIAIIQIVVVGTSDYGLAFRSLASAFSVAVILGLVIGMVWLRLLKNLEGAPFLYLLTIGVVFALYAGTEFLKGSGAVAALIFGMVLSNGHEFVRIFKLKTHLSLNEDIRRFHSEVTFFIRTFFFVYIGILFNYKDVSLLLLLASVIIVVSLFLVRFLLVKTTIRLRSELKSDFNVIWTMLPRGLAAAVLATVPLTSGVQGTEWFTHVVFMVIVGTCIIATIGAAVNEHQSSKLKKSSLKEEDTALTPSTQQPQPEVILLKPLPKEEEAINSNDQK